MLKNKKQKNKTCSRSPKQQSRDLDSVLLRALLASAIRSRVWLVSPTDGQRLEAMERAFTSLGLTSLCPRQIRGAELIGHHLITGLFCAGGAGVGLLFLQTLPRVLRREGQIVHQRRAARRAA